MLLREKYVKNNWVWPFHLNAQIFKFYDGNDFILLNIDLNASNIYIHWGYEFYQIKLKIQLK